MKNLILATVLSLGSLTVFAQEANSNNREVRKEVSNVATSQDNFTEVATSDLPEAITAAVAKNYPTAKINKAYVNNAKQYKLEVALQDGTIGTLYSDEKGNWIDI
ncbi:hypothetical protein K8352_05635 [Flavobacteriaceae bacterium F89]|uniref:Beta-lactamase-inhibitor-like PepSY-like domain-containing protein n=1 Tax=Cerina litoralis TaxID=2874477 RepID=A0AAE3EV39_9FLAO|nr:hypothetical protein [Cerina litoralis]MCG2460221.1 hypothetical protein [Cerina litoralis]